MLKRDARVPSRVAALLRPTPIPPFLLLLLLLLIIINKKRVIVIKHISTQKKEKRDMKKHEIILVFISYTFVYYYFSPISNKNTRIGILFPRNFDTLHTHTHTHTHTRERHAPDILGCTRLWQKRPFTASPLSPLVPR